MTDRMCGTIRYSAPEILLGYLYLYPADVFALGVLMKELVEGCAPFHGHGEEHDEVVHKTLFETPGIPFGSHIDINAFNLSSAVSSLSLIAFTLFLIEIYIDAT